MYDFWDLRNLDIPNYIIKIIQWIFLIGRLRIRNLSYNKLEIIATLLLWHSDWLVFGDIIHSQSSFSTIKKLELKVLTMLLIKFSNKIFNDRHNFFHFILSFASLFPFVNKNFTLTQYSLCRRYPPYLLECKLTLELE